MRVMPVVAAIVGLTLVTPPVWADQHAESIVVAGFGAAGFAGDGGAAVDAQLSGPQGLVFGRDGTLFIADTRNRVVRAVGSDGVIRTVVGTGPEERPPTPLPAGVSLPGREVTLGEPMGLAAGADGTIYIADGGAARVLALSPDGDVTAYAGTGQPGFAGDGGAASQAQIGNVRAVAAAPDGTVYLGDLRGRRVRAVAPDGQIRSVMGNGSPDITTTGPASEAGFPFLNSLAVDGRGALWMTSTALQRLSDGTVNTELWDGANRWRLSDPQSPTPPTNAVIGVSVAVVGDTVYVLQDDGVWRLRPNGDADRIAAGRWRGHIAIDPSGDIYVSHPEDNRVYRLRPPTPADDSPGSPALVWLIAGAGVLVAVLVIVAWAVRRRGAGRVSPGKRP